MTRVRSLRFFIALVAAYALAMQGLLGATLAAKALDKAASADPFAICLASKRGAPADHGGTDKSSVAHQHCVLCGFAKNTDARLGPEQADVALARVASVARLFRPHERAAPLFSPTGTNPRGPPASQIA